MGSKSADRSPVQIVGLERRVRKHQESTEPPARRSVGGREGPSFLTNWKGSLLLVLDGILFQKRAHVLFIFVSLMLNTVSTCNRLSVNVD